MITFGGQDLKTMYITSACQKLTQEQLAVNPMEGCLLSYQAPYPSIVESRFGG
jgi:sugar lactone lactonase YvrE